jgi:hypothetical protein
VQRIEKEVRLKLALQSQKFGIAELCLQLKSSKFTLPVLSVIKEGMRDYKNRDVNSKNVFDQIP